MARKPKTEYQIVCSGKGKPWHLDAQNRTHRHQKKSHDAATKDAAALNDDPRTPLALECVPWTIETREVGQWHAK